VKRKWQTITVPRPRWSSAPSRQFSSTTRTSAGFRRRGSDQEERDIWEDIDAAGDYDSLDPREYLQPSQPITVNDLFPEAREEYETLSEPEKQKYMALQNHYAAVAENLQSESTHEDRTMTMALDGELAREDDLSFPVVGLRGNEVGYWAGGEKEDEFSAVEDADDDQDVSDLTSVAHSELEVHREVREYTRVAAWDMPLLQRKSQVISRLLAGS
jgi:small subunit ribosomal protein S35